MPKQPSVSPRHSFLLRCWQERSAADAKRLRWRFSLREVKETPQEHNFSSPGQLIDFLLAKLEEKE